MRNDELSPRVADASIYRGISIDAVTRTLMDPLVSLFVTPVKTHPFLFLKDIHGSTVETYVLRMTIESQANNLPYTTGHFSSRHTVHYNNHMQISATPPSSSYNQA